MVRNEADPYLCFRRRESKPIRKTRRTDQQSIEKLRKLRMEMESARSLLEMVSRREKVRKESLVHEHMIFDQRTKVREQKRILGIKDEDDDLQHQKVRLSILVSWCHMNSAPSSARILNCTEKDPQDRGDERYYSYPTQLQGPRPEFVTGRRPKGPGPLQHRVRACQAQRRRCWLGRSHRRKCFLPLLFVVVAAMCTYFLVLSLCCNSQLLLYFATGNAQ